MTQVATMDISQRLKLLTEMMSKFDTPKKHLEVVGSFSAFYSKKGTLTPGQLSYLSSLEEQYSQSALDDLSLWRSEYAGKKKEDAYKVALYYRTTHYFTRLVERVLADLPISRGEYQKLCENKYAKKILTQYEQDPAFAVGQMVELRKNNKLSQANPGRLPVPRPQFAAIIEIDAKPIIRAAKGARIYKILPVGGTVLYAHESDLKKIRKRSLEAG